MKINKRFQEYIDRQNRWGTLLSGRQITFPLTQEDVTSLATSLSRDLSPENLYCDGEISAKQAKTKYNKLTGVVKDLTAYAKKNGLTEPIIHY